ncbi:soluble epoxide hydrolase [mine drainage metagenome]|uniref:Soluble epoxide hydrolase n=1 Tax=mine drainage metagenome TaxID=410659 RepID=A0A1J5Q6S4_9ZZZZ
MEQLHINIEGKAIGYKTAGTGTPVILLHGWPQTSHMWRKVVSAIASRHQVIMIDLPGLGGSETYDIYDTGFIAEIIAKTAQTLGVSEYHLVGHDIGAWVAVAQARLFEGQLRSLTVIDAGIPGLIPDAIFKPENAQRVWQFYFHAVADIPELLIKGREKEYLAWYFRNKSIVKDAITDLDVAYYAEQYSRQHAMSNGFGYYRAFSLSAEQNSAVHQKLTIPILAIGAASGVGASIGMAMDKIAERATTKVIANCGHYVPEERPSEFAELLLSFMEDRQARANERFSSYQQAAL